MHSISSASSPLLATLDTLVDNEVGIIQFLRELPREPGAPNFFHFYAKACNAQHLGGGRNFSDAGGASSTRNAALSKAVGEAVERYCSSFYCVSEFIFGSFSSLKYPCSPPESFALYGPSQYKDPSFPYAPFNKDTPVFWVASTNLMTKQICYVPASMVYLPYLYQKNLGEHKIAQRISTGLACHEDLARASISAICEVIERDAFSISWQGKVSPPQIDIGTLSAKNRDLIRRFNRTGSQVTVFNITTDVEVPAILSVLANPNLAQPALVFAASCELDPENAVRKSLEELAHTQRLAGRLKTGRNTSSYGLTAEMVKGRDDHVYFYCLHENSKFSDFIFQTSRIISFSSIKKIGVSDPEGDLKLLIEKIKKIGETIYLCDLTTSDVKKLGFRVVRALIPGLHPLFMGHSNRALGGRRLWTVPQILGHPGIVPMIGDNPNPHPYP